MLKNGRAEKWCDTRPGSLAFPTMFIVKVHLPPICAHKIINGSWVFLNKYVMFFLRRQSTEPARTRFSQTRASKARSFWSCFFAYCCACGFPFGILGQLFFLLYERNSMGCQTIYICHHWYEVRQNNIAHHLPRYSLSKCLIDIRKEARHIH